MNQISNTTPPYSTFPEPTQPRDPHASSDRSSDPVPHCYIRCNRYVVGDTSLPLKQCAIVSLVYIGHLFLKVSLGMKISCHIICSNSFYYDTGLD